MKKNNKKGFTLIELLAVIVILAILATAAFTLVLPRIEEARKKSFISEISGVMDAADQYFFDNPSEDCFVIANSGASYLKNFDSTNMKGVVKKNTTGGNTVSYTNGTYRTNGTTLYTMGLLESKGVPNSTNIVTGDDAAESCT